MAAESFFHPVTGCIHIFHISQEMFAIALIAYGFLLIFWAFFSNETASSFLSVFVSLGLSLFLFVFLALSLSFTSVSLTQLGRATFL